MKKRYIVFALICSLILLVPRSAKVSAENYYGAKNEWKVRFTNKSKMVSTFDSDEYNDIINAMQPGDNVQFTLDLKNQNSKTTRWYMKNDVIKSLEEVSANKRSAASDGTYVYILTYTDSDGTEKELFNSDSVGGETDEDTVDEDILGLHEATEDLKDWFYLDTLKKGKGGTIDLYVGLDGETQGNSYQDTKAQLNMQFAVEIPSKDNGDSNKSGKVAKTGDDSNWTLYSILTLIGGAGLLGLGGYSIKSRKQQKEEDDER